jgi:phosphoribosylpyrophosphate synthetase
MKGMPPSDADSRLMVFSGNANPPLAQSMANYLRVSLGKAVVSEFSWCNRPVPRQTTI